MVATLLIVNNGNLEPSVLNSFTTVVDYFNSDLKEIEDEIEKEIKNIPEPSFEKPKEVFHIPN